MIVTIDTTTAYSNDTIINLLNQIVANTVEHKDSYYYLSFNEVITLLLAILSVAIAIYQFNKQMRKNREEQKVANKKNWFLSVIVLPQIEDVNAFYKKIIEDVLSDMLILQPGNSGNIILLSEKQAERKEQINAFFDHLQSLVRSFDISLSRRIADEVEKLEDEVTTMLGDFYFNIDNPTRHEIRRRLLLSKKNVISLLYQKTQDDD